MYRPTGNAKYDAARAVLRYAGVFITDYKAASIYTALEAAGWRWNAEAGKWQQQANEKATQHE